MRAIEALRRLVRNSDRAEEIKQGIANQTDLLNGKLHSVILVVEKQTTHLGERLEAIREELTNQSALLNCRLEAMTEARTAHLEDQGIGNAFTELIGSLRDLIELQKGQLIMQREHTEAIDNLTAILKQGPLMPAPLYRHREPEA